RRAEPYLYVLPAALFVVFFLLYPMVLTFWRSFTSYDGITAPVFVGLENFRELFVDAHFLISLRNTLIWTVAAVALPVTLCLVFNLTRRIVIPMLMPFIVIATLLAVVNGFKVFDLIWVMTQGGPGRSSETLAVTMYREGFILFKQGYSAAIAVIISLGALLFSYFYLRSVLDQESQI